MIRTKQTGAIAVAIAVLLVLLSYVTIATTIGVRSSSSSTPSSTSSYPSSSTSVASSSSSSSPEANPNPLQLWVEDCMTSYQGFGGICSVSSSIVGQPQAFNMTSVFFNTTEEKNYTTIHELFFGVQVNQSDDLQFTFTGSNATDFQVYLDNRTGASTSSLANEVANYSPSILVNESNVDYFAGQVNALRPGLYIFVFSVSQPEPGNAVSFILRNADAYPNGKISVAPALFQPVTVQTYNAGELKSVSGFGWQKYPLTIYSNMTTPVNMTAVNVPSGAWVEFVPSYLPEVGPKGANVTMYVAGATVLGTVGNRDNVSMFINAVGQNGVVAETYLPLDGPRVDRPLTVLQSPSPTASSFGDWGSFSVQQNTSATGSTWVVYDQSSSSASASLSLNLTVAGILQGGQTVPLPDGLQVYWTNQTISLTGDSLHESETDNITGGAPLSSFAFTLPADRPYYFDIGFKVSSSLPVGNEYTVVLDETVNGRQYLGYLAVTVYPYSPPVVQGFP
jgi:hypothetical protein